ncbi:MAG: hypothetical protein V7K27_34620 [Nostoc sp.]|uniref:hypothetical protein n=1 Tax=Nostoc sp. TaxID=1180 RepID=UPI002FFB8B76
MSNVPVERLQVTFASTPISIGSPLQPGCYAAIATQINLALWRFIPYLLLKFSDFLNR